MNFTACSLQTIVSVAVLLNVHLENTIIKIINWKIENSRILMFQCLVQSLFMLSTVIALAKDMT